MTTTCSHCECETEDLEYVEAFELNLCDDCLSDHYYNVRGALSELQTQADLDVYIKYVA